MSAKSAAAPVISPLDEDRQNTENKKSSQSAPAGYRKIIELSESSLEAARQHGNPPTPTVYDVWYNYASGKNHEMVDHINRLVAAGRGIDEYVLGQIHDQFLTNNEKSKQLDQATEQFDHQVSKIYATIDSHSDACREFSESLGETSETLSSIKSVQGVRHAVNSLIDRSRAMDDRTREIHRMLDESQKEIEFLQEALEASQKRELLDPLTGTLNRRGFEHELLAEIGEALGRNRPLTLMIADIDHFKNINDSYGHLIGDEVIKYVGKLLQNNVRPDDVVARYGGEEFAVLLRNCEVGSGAVKAEKIRRDLAATTLKITRSNATLKQITVSIGLSQFKKSDEPDDLIDRADKEMYRSKEKGRNRISF